ncbi:hypothetical protein BDF22DRAFT_697739 [Syncephalis plumigaleata]|nr:hypothetical protein BDF22DRAFT_697739 [Syncephalis plumigaleata]
MVLILLLLEVQVRNQIDAGFQYSNSTDNEAKKANITSATSMATESDSVDSNINLETISDASYASQSLQVDDTPQVGRSDYTYCSPSDRLDGDHSQSDATKENIDTKEIAAAATNGTNDPTYDKPVSSHDLSSDTAYVETTDSICVCPICDKDITQLPLPERELHADQCAHTLLERTTPNTSNTISNFINQVRSPNSTTDYTKELASLNCCPVCRMAWSMNKHPPRERMRHMRGCAQQCRIPLDKSTKNNDASSDTNTTTYESTRFSAVPPQLASRRQNSLNFLVKADDDAFAPVLHTHRQTALALSASMSTTSKISRAKRQRNYTLKTLASDILCVNEALDLIRDRATYLLAEQSAISLDTAIKHDDNDNDPATFSWIWRAAQGEAPSHDSCYRTDILKNVQCQ